MRPDARAIVGLTMGFVQAVMHTFMTAAVGASGQATPTERPSAKRKGPPPSTVPHGEAPSPPPTGSTKKRPKRAPSKQAKVDATAAKKAAIAAEVARGPLPIKRHDGEGPFAPQLMPVGLFDSDEPGERWAAHPDYAPSEVLVSNRGRVRKRGHAGVGEYDYFTLGSLTKKGYRTVGINVKHRRVHILVCEAFHGPKPSGKNLSVDHYPDRNRSNNRADNLRWATPPEQNGNQETHRAHSNGKPVLARKVGSPDDAEWTPYASAWAAGKALGINVGNISEVCNPEKTRRTTAGGYEFRHAPPPEDQGDLPWEELGPPHARFCVPRERWKLDPESDGRTRVSTRGRVQTKTARGECWSLRYTPQAASGEVYPYEDHQVNTGRGAGTTNFVELNPLKVDLQLLHRGRERYTINCAPCHGGLGDGNGITKKYGMAVVGNLHDKRMVLMPDGEIFNTLSYGKGLMQGYAGQIDVQDRWAIVAYVRALQLARLGTTNDVPASEQAALRK